MKRRAEAKDVMKKLLSARAFIGAAFKHGQYKVIRSLLNAGARKKRGETRQRRPEISLSRRNISTLYRRGHFRRGEGDQWLIVGAPSVTSGRSERTQTLPCIFKIIFFYCVTFFCILTNILSPTVTAAPDSNTSATCNI